MSRSQRKSITLVLMSWSAIALSILAITVGYLLYDLSKRQFLSDWDSKNRIELNALQQQLTRALANDDKTQADRAVAMLATQPFISRIDVSQNGRYLFSSRRSRIGNRIGNEALSPTMQPLVSKGLHDSIQIRSGSSADQRLVSSYAAYYPLGKRQQARILIELEYDLSQPYQQMQGQVLLKFLLLLLVLGLYFLGMARLLRHYVLKPLRDLGHYVEQLQNDHACAVLPATPIREFYRLGKAFQQLNTYLQHSIARIKNRYSLEQAFSNTFPDIAFVVDAEGRIRERFGNRSPELLDPQTDLSGQLLWSWLEDSQQAQVRGAWQQACAEQQTVIRSFQHDGHFLESRMTPFVRESNQQQNVLWVLRDMTELQQKQIEIEYRAHYDALTNLGNRQHALEMVAIKLQQAQQQQCFGAVLFVDLDQFKKINDSMGHAVGDAVLQEAASRLRSVCQPSDACTRLGGDEFLLIIDQLYHDAAELIDKATDLASVLLQQYRLPFNYERHSFHLSASIGIALFPFKQLSASDLIRQADTAMYYAKANGRNGWSIYNERMQQESQSRLNLLNDLHDAIQARAFNLVMQPQVNAEGQVIGAEVLCRWSNRGQPVPPDIFIAAAEEANLIVELGDWILAESCRLLRQWQDDGVMPDSFERLAINISPHQFLEADFIERLLAHTRYYQLHPDMIELEITEGVFVNDKHMVQLLIQELVEHGFSVSLDDFGTGYSSLNYLQSLPIQTLKIDRSFVNYLQDNPDDANIVDYIIQLGHNLSMDIIAEGVETSRQYDYLVALGCEKFQGYLFSQPLQPDDFVRYLSDKA
ncbi:putative bifunctional diguanylate cyclase/phosphodiesterase [Oceanobacter mangrovi]|uniref:putative bifunctional diguanylate cyclase/phosphodiesterase n=1 Tax=Oceanobacter mangrovi TaxID=2862510 RepID=UPI001C8D36CC|nr:EAL domain-containing protein [Oceanobacter mangrovi]